MTGLTCRPKSNSKTQFTRSVILYVKVSSPIAPDNDSPSNSNLLNDSKVEEHNLAAEWKKQTQEVETYHLESNQNETQTHEILRKARA